MKHNSWLRRFGSPRRSASRSTPRLEYLEDRCVLTTIVGLTSTDALVRFDSATPGTQIAIGAITGLNVGQTIDAIAFNPTSGQLYGLGINSTLGVGNVTGQLYQLNDLTAAATAVGAGIPFSTKLSGSEYAFSYDPVSGNFRVVDNAGENLSVSGASGALLSTNSVINPGSDTITAMAYNNNFPQATASTLYGYDEANNQIVTIGSPFGSPNSPNTGTISVVGTSGVKNSSTGADLGFTIDANNTAYLNIVVNGTSNFYTANLSTGVVTFVNPFGVGVTMADIAVAPTTNYYVGGFPASRTAGVGSSITVEALTAYGTIATGYVGTVHFTSHDPSAALPIDSTLTIGASTFTVTLNTPGTQSVTVTDTVNGNVFGEETNITVLPNTELVGVTTSNQLVRFNSATPGIDTVIGTITGLAAGQNVVGVAFRPATTGLYAMGYGSGTGQIYTINPTTAVATAIGAPFSTTLSGVDFGFSFDPVQDLIRVTSNDNENFTIDPNTGIATQDAILTPTSSNVVGLAYYDNFAGAASTTLYGYDVGDDNLVLVGSAGSDTSSNGGVVTKIGLSGVTSSSGAGGETGFAIDANGGAYLNLDVGGNSQLYTANLASGLVSLNGTFGAGIVMRDIAVAPAVGFTFGNLGATRVAGANSPVSINAVDAYGNVAAGYQGIVHLTSSDAAAVLPADSGLTDGSGFYSSVVFNTIGTQSLTATDTVLSQVTSTASNILVVAPVDIVGLTSTGSLVHFNSSLLSSSGGGGVAPNSSPGSFTTIGQVTGIASGQTLVAIAFRPANDQLYGLAVGTGLGQLYQIDPTTAVATPLISSFSLQATDTSYGFGFDPVNDVARVTSNNGENLRINPTTGAFVIIDPSLTPSSVYGGAAYNDSFLGATQSTLYSYDFNNNQIVTIGGSPNSPGSGTVSAVGPSGVTASSGTAGDIGFSFGGDGVGYLNLVANGSSGLYTANLSSGILSLVGTFANGVTMVSESVAPAASFKVAGIPSPINTNKAATFTVKSIDAYGQTVPTYQGTVTFTSSDNAASLPANTTLTNGLGTFTVTFHTVGTQSLTVSDVAVPTINGSEDNIVVTNGTSPPGPPPPVSLVDRIGIVRAAPDNRSGIVALNSAGGGSFSSSDAEFTFGFSTDKFVVGDWADIGYDSLGVARPTTSGALEWVLDSNGDNQYDFGDAVYSYGINGDIPVVGDWSGNGATEIGIVRPTASGALEWVLNSTGTGSYNSGDEVFFFGQKGDIPVVGDWTGSGKTEIGIVRPSASGALEWVLDTTGTGSYNFNDAVYYYGANTDTPVVGDWTGSGTSKIGVSRSTSSGVLQWVLDVNGTGAYSSNDSVFYYGLNGDRPLVGKWQLPAALWSGDGLGNNLTQPLTPNANFVSTIDQAIDAWQQAGLPAQQVAQLENANYSIGTLSGGLLGATSGNDIVIDSTAAGHGWSTGSSPLAGQMDLFTTLAHEMGHDLGLPDQSTNPGDIMFDSLMPGVRKAPNAQDVDAVFAAMGH